MIRLISSRRPGVAVALCLVGLITFAAFASQALAETPEDQDLRAPALCFAPGTPPDVIQRALERSKGIFERNSLSPPSFEKHRIATRWYATATDGSGLLQGDPTTLTWSVVPDGTSIPSGVGEPAATSNLRAFLNGIYGDESTWMSLFQQVFDRWGELSGITYVHEASDDGAQMSHSFSGQIGVRGDIRIGGKLIDGNYGVLAYNYYPDNGDMVIDTADTFYTNISSNSLNLRNVMAHEHGHGLGLEHVCPVNSTKLMEPYVSSSYDGPQHDDILAVNRSYGDRFEHDETPGAAAALGTIGSTTEANLSVDDNTDTDVYSFVVDASGEIDLTLTPVGMTYLEGPQNTDGSCSAGSSYDTLNIQDLALRVLDVDGTSVLAEVDDGGVGEAETLVDVTLTSGAGTYYVEVTGDATDDAQLYELSMTVNPSDSIFSDDFESGDTSAWSSTVP